MPEIDEQRLQSVSLRRDDAEEALSEADAAREDELSQTAPSPASAAAPDADASLPEMANTFRTALSNMLPVFREYRRKGYNEERVDDQDITRLEILLKQTEDTQQQAKLQLAAPQPIIDAARDFLKQLTLFSPPADKRPESVRTRRLVALALSTLTEALGTLNEEARISLLNREDIRRSLEEELADATGQAQDLLPQALSGENNARLNLLLSSLLAEHTLTRQQLCAWLSSRAGIIRNDADDIRNEVQAIKHLQAGLTGFATQDLRSAYHSVSNRSSQHGAAAKAVTELTSAALSLSRPLESLAEQLDKKAQSLLIGVKDEKPGQAKSPEDTRDTRNLLKTLLSDARDYTSTQLKNVSGTTRKKGRGVSNMANTIPPYLAAQGKNRFTRAFRKFVKSQSGTAAGETIRASALLFLDELQQAEQMTARLVSQSRIRQEAVEQYEALRGYAAPEGAAPAVAPDLSVSGALESRLAAEAARWAQVESEAATALQNALPATGTAEKEALYNRLSAPLQALSVEKICAEFNAFLHKQVSVLFSLTADMQHHVLSLSARGHEGGRVLQEKAADWVRGLSMLKSTVKTSVTRLTGRSLNNFSRDGMLTRGIAAWEQEQRQAFIQDRLAEGMPAAHAEDLFDRTTTPLLEAGLAEFTKSDDPSGRLFLQRLALARRHAAASMLVQPRSPEEVLAGSRTVPEDLRRWAENRLVTGAFSALLKQGISLTTGTVTLPLRIGLRLVRLTVTVARGTRAINRGVRVGKGRPDRTINRLVMREGQKATIRLVLSVSPAVGYGVAGAVTLGRLRREGVKETAQSVAGKVPLELVLRSPEMSWLAGGALGRANLARTPGRGGVLGEYFFEGEVDDRGRLTSVIEAAGPEAAEGAALQVTGPGAERRLSGEVQDTPVRRVRRSAVTVTIPAKNENQNTALENWINHVWEGKSFLLPTTRPDNSIIKFEQATYIKLHGKYYLYHQTSNTRARIENLEGESVDIQKENPYVNKWSLSDRKSIKHGFMAEFIHQANIDKDFYPELYRSLSAIMKRDKGQDTVTVITNLNRKINEFIFLRGGGQKNNSMLPIFIFKLQLIKLADLDQEQQNKIIETEKSWLTTYEIDADILLQQSDMLLNPQEIDEEIYLTALERINQRAALKKSKARLSDLLSDIEKKIMSQNEIISNNANRLQSFLNSGKYKRRSTAFANPIEIDKEKTRLEFFLANSETANETLKLERKKAAYSLSLVEDKLNPTSSPDKIYLHAIKHGTEIKNILRQEYSSYFKDNKNLESFVLLKAISDISQEENEITNSTHQNDENAESQITSLRVTRNYLIDYYNLQQKFTNLISKIPAYDYQPSGNHKDVNFAKVEALKLFCDMMGIDRPNIKNTDTDFQSFVSEHESGRSDLLMLESLIFYKINNKNVDMSVLDYSTVSDFFTDKLYNYKNALRFNEPALPEEYLSLTQFVPGHFYTSSSDYYQQFAEYNNNGSADYDATNLANTLLSDVEFTDSELTKEVEVWKFKMDWKQDEYQVRGQSGLSKSAKTIAPVGTGTLIRLGNKHIFIYNIDGNLKTQILDKKEVRDPDLFNNYVISVGFKSGKFTRHNEFYKKMLGDIQPPKQANASARFTLHFSPKETTVSSSAKDAVKKAFKGNLSDIIDQYKISNDYSTLSYKAAAIFIPLFDKIYHHLYDPTYKLELDAYDVLDIITLSTSFASLGFKSIKLSRETLKGLQAAIKEDRAANLAANVIFKNSLKRAAQAVAEFNIKLGKNVANEIINIVEPLPVRDMYKYIRREFKTGKIGKNIVGTYNRETFNNSSINDEFIEKGVSQDAGAVSHNRKAIDTSGEEKVTLAPVENLLAKSMDFTLSDVDDINIDTKKLLNDLHKNREIEAMINRPAGKCEAVMEPVANFMTKEGFTDIQYRGIYIWANGTDQNPMNHFAVIGKKNGVDYVFDLTAHQFANSGMRDFEDPQILTLLSWEEKWRNATTRKLIVCSDFKTISSAKSNYSSFLPVEPIDFFTNAKNEKLDYSFITEPGMLTTLRKMHPGIIKTSNVKTGPSRINSHLADDLGGGISPLTLLEDQPWQSSLSKGKITGVTIKSEHNGRLGIISTPGNESDTLTLFSHGASFNEDYTTRAPEDLQLYFHTPHRTKLNNPGLGIFVHDNVLPYSFIDGKRYTISFHKDSWMTTPVPQVELRKKLFDNYHPIKSRITPEENKDRLLATGTTKSGEVSNYLYTSVFKEIDEDAFKLGAEANRLSQTELGSLDPNYSHIVQQFAAAPAPELIKSPELTDIMHILPNQAVKLEEVIKITREKGYKKLKLIHCRVLLEDKNANTYIANLWRTKTTAKAENTLDNIDQNIESVMNIDLEKNSIDIFYPNLINAGIPFSRRVELHNTAISTQEEASLPQSENYVAGESDDGQPDAVHPVSRYLQTAGREYFADVPALPDNYPLDVTDDPAVFVDRSFKYYMQVNNKFLNFKYAKGSTDEGYLIKGTLTVYVVKNNGQWTVGIKNPSEDFPEKGTKILNRETESAPEGHQGAIVSGHIQVSAGPVIKLNSYPSQFPDIPLTEPPGATLDPLISDDESTPVIDDIIISQADSLFTRVNSAPGKISSASQSHLCQGPEGELYMLIGKKYIPFKFYSKDNAGVLYDSKAAIFIKKTGSRWVHLKTEHPREVKLSDKYKDFINTITNGSLYMPSRPSLEDIKYDPKRFYIDSKSQYLFINNYFIPFKSLKKDTLILTFKMQYGDIEKEFHYKRSGRNLILSE